MKINVDGENIEFVFSYIAKYIDPEIVYQAGHSLSERLNYVRDFVDLDVAVVKKMMTAYRVAKKRKLDKEAGNELVTISITKESHQILKDMAVLFDSNLVDVVEVSRLQCNANLAGEVRGLILSRDGVNDLADNLRFEVKFLKDKVSILENQVSMIDDVRAINSFVISEKDRLEQENQRLKKIIEGLETADIFQAQLQQCQGLTASGQQCKRVNDLSVSDGVLLCNVHKSLQSQGKLKTVE